MEVTFGEILLVLLLVGFGVYRFQALRIRELALQAVRRGCSRQGFQLLDETVSIRRVSLSRDDRGIWRVWRQYRFEYSEEGVERKSGYVVMLGRRVQVLVIAEPTIH